MTTEAYSSAPSVPSVLTATLPPEYRGFLQQREDEMGSQDGKNIVHEKAVVYPPHTADMALAYHELLEASMKGFNVTTGVHRRNSGQLLVYFTHGSDYTRRHDTDLTPAERIGERIDTLNKNLAKLGVSRDKLMVNPYQEQLMQYEDKIRRRR